MSYDRFYTVQGVCRAAVLAALIAVVAVLLFGCTSIGHKPPPDDWPYLKVTTKYLDGAAIIPRCYAVLPLWLKLLGGLPTACAMVDFAAMTCTIYVPEGDQDALKHEQAHCDGRDHGTDSTLGDAWSAWKIQMGPGKYIYVRAR